MIEKIQIYISIIAAVAITITSIVMKATLYDMVLRLIIVIVLFYFLGLIFKYYLMKNVFPPEDKTANAEEPPVDDGVALADAPAEFNETEGL